MKKLLICLLTLVIVACKEDPKDYVTLSGKVDNAEAFKNITIFKNQDYKKEITLNADGTFSDTLKIDEGDYALQIGKEYGTIYLKNGNEIAFTSDYENFDKQLKFTGDDSDNSNFLLQQYHLSEESFSEDLFSDGTDEDLKQSIKNFRSGFKNLKNTYKKVDSVHLAQADLNVEQTINGVTQYFNSKLAMRSAFVKGTPSPSFVNYENYKGGKTSLEDLKGKYVYIDLWATWCGPCKREIPSLKKLEEAFKGKSIEFVSISVDDGRGYRANTKEESAKMAYEGWKKMIADKQLGGIQLYADNNWESDFIKTYKVRSIPRFILIDPQGNIVNADAPRPSNPKLKVMLEQLMG